jgi:hypothetical protein
MYEFGKMYSLKLLIIIVAAVWINACAHTGSPEPAKPEKEKPAEQTAESRTTSPDTTESEQKESQEKSQSSRSPSQASAEPKLEKPTEYKTPSSKASVKAADARLEEARENLQTSRETEQRIASDLEQLKKSGGTSTEAIEDYEEYLARVRTMTIENRKIVEQLEAAYNRHNPEVTNSAISNNSAEMYDPSIPEEQTVEEVAALDKEFNESLAGFDDRLLKEMESIRIGSAKKLQDLAQEAADAAKRLRDRGVEVNTSGSGSSRETDEQKGSSESSRQTKTTEDTADTETASRDSSRNGGKGESADDRHRTDYEDDDIVARQLREAAENETDPELKEKLWQEYEAYKKSER